MGHLQIADIHEPLLHGVSHALIPPELDGLPEESVLSGLAELLYEADEALIARALFDLDTTSAASVPLFYALLPASTGSSFWLLARRYCLHPSGCFACMHLQTCRGVAWCLSLLGELSL